MENIVLKEAEVETLEVDVSRKIATRKGMTVTSQENKLPSASCLHAIVYESQILAQQRKVCHYHYKSRGAFDRRLIKR